MNLYIFSAQAVVSESSRFRVGARHPLIIYATEQDIDAAQLKAVEFAENKGWSFIEVQRRKQIDDDTSLIDDEINRAAAQDASKRGCGIVVYRDEIPANS